jgi:GAF domain-containing protein
LHELAEEQAALRRVATLVASGAPPDDVFTAVADELGHLIGAEATFVSRVEYRAGERGDVEGHLTVVGSYGRISRRLPTGSRLKLPPDTIQAEALHTGRPARVNGERLTQGRHAAWAAALGIRAAVATPIVVAGHPWA